MHWVSANKRKSPFLLVSENVIKMPKDSYNIMVMIAPAPLYPQSLKHFPQNFLLLRLSIQVFFQVSGEVMQTFFFVCPHQSPSMHELSLGQKPVRYIRSTTTILQTENINL